MPLSSARAATIILPPPIAMRQAADMFGPSPPTPLAQTIEHRDQVVGDFQPFADYPSACSKQSERSSHAVDVNQAKLHGSCKCSSKDRESAGITLATYS